MKFDQNVGDQIADALDDRKKMYGRIIATRWAENSEAYLRAESKRRSSEMDGDSGLYRIADEFTDPDWDEGQQQWVFTVDHPAAVIHEVGAKEHEIRARKAQVLAFEWPDAPDHIKEMFSHTEGDLVFFKSVDHPGVPAVGYIAEGRDRVKEELERGGNDMFSSDDFTLGTGGSGPSGFSITVGGGE